MTEKLKFPDSGQWITFSADLRKASPRLWLMLGECQALCEQVARLPLLPEYVGRISRIFLGRGALSSAAISGNALSEKEVIRSLKERIPVPPSRKQAFREVENIIEGCGRALGDYPEGEVIELTAAGFSELNRIVLRGLAVEKNSLPGVYRAADIPPEESAAPEGDCASLMERLCQWLNGPGFTGGGDRRIANAVIRAALAHLYLAGIHPFREGNGRTARLLEYHILVSAGVPSISALLPAIHYNLTREEYSRQLELAWKTGEVVPFIQYSVLGFLDGLRGQTGQAHEHQWDVAWKCHILEFFQDTTTESDIRRRHLALDLSTRDDPIPLSEIPLVSPRLARAYAKRVERTLIRDLNFLREAGLVEKTAEGYRMMKEYAAGFGTEQDMLMDPGGEE